MAEATSSVGRGSISAAVTDTGARVLPVREVGIPKGGPPWSAAYRHSAIALDAMTGAAAGLFGTSVLMSQRPLVFHVVLPAIIMVLWISALALNHGYEARYLGTTTEEYRSVVRAAVVLFCAVALVSYGWKLELSRGMVMFVTPLLLIFGLTVRHALRHRLYRRRIKGLDLQRTVVIGDMRSVGPLIREIRSATFQGMDVVAACVSGLGSGPDDKSDVEGVPVFGYPEEAISAVDLFDAEVVAVSSHPDLAGPELRRLSWSLEDRGVDLVVAPGILEVAGPRLSIRPAAGMTLLHVERPVMSGARRILKHVADRVMSLVLSLAAIPVLIVIALAVRIDSPGPVLFRQRRIGANGVPFEMLKFRTMCVDAEARLWEFQEAAADRDENTHAGNKVLFKLKQDPRVTPMGKLLRRYSLDELPQLINVMRGEMSLVGPRPPLPCEVEQYEPDAARRLRVQPGLTGLWQVSGRSDLTWDESLRLDLWYVDNWSLVLDFVILARTLRAVLRGQGAY